MHPAAPASRFRLIHIRQRSLLRADGMTLSALAMSFLLSHFPHIQPNPLLAVPLLLAIAGTADATRCMQARWNFYHGAVILSLYMDILILTLILFFLLWPYFRWFI